ncbi:hypothetical protein HPL003_14715 [Paenibacillus terrae HPL-003]|uniref:Uncharacterized protein n=1 Tax=Paenibacillus terrae (strain HPL-003) TaxID=985665 RepID=G7W2B0_PAETH|nr:hypothetical protein HPL003_14715 [Paenibacillus terrae HPL-003]
MYKTGKLIDGKLFLKTWDDKWISLRLLILLVKRTCE